MITLTAGISLLLAIPLGAIGRRIDGGVFHTWLNWDAGKILTRTLCALGITIPMMIAGMPLVHALMFMAAIWIGGIFGMGTGLGMGRPEHDRTGSPDDFRTWLRAFMDMTMYGLLTVLPGVFVLWLLGYHALPVFLVGLSCGLIYELAFRAPLDWPAMGCLERDPPPTAELIWGAMRSTAGVICVLLGSSGDNFHLVFGWILWAVLQLASWL